MLCMALIHDLDLSSLKIAHPIDKALKERGSSVCTESFNISMRRDAVKITCIHNVA